MKPTNHFLRDMLDLDAPEAANDVIYVASEPTAAKAVAGGAAVLTVPFRAINSGNFFTDESKPLRTFDVIVRAYGDSIVRVSCSFDGAALPDGVATDDSPMLQFHKSLAPVKLTVRKTAAGWDLVDPKGKVRFRVDTTRPPKTDWKHGGSNWPVAAEFSPTVFPDGKTPVRFQAYDQFFPMLHDSLPLAFAERDGRIDRTAFALHVAPGEKFAGTGERFAGPNLAGQTLVLENTDGSGVNSRRTYKNMPFYVSSRGYGVFMHTSAHIRLALASVSTRATSAAIAWPAVDLFFLGGGSVERAVYNFRRVSGFPANVPLWSLGTWMSRMTYHSAAEMDAVCDRLRKEKFPADVIHADTGWFKQNWNCDWEFSPERFPNTADWIATLRRRGFRLSLWQMPMVRSDNPHFELCRENKFVLPKRQAAVAGGSNFSNLRYDGHIDFSNPGAVSWYQGVLEKLLKLGASAIKTDFGEGIDMDADYVLPAELLHNLYGLLYQKAAYEVTARVTGEPLIFARAGWAGCQRYPLHWGGDSAATWDGLAGTIRGGLHAGLSGYGFWSHDVPGFYGNPDFMSNWPDETLYVRWTQMGVFTSHLRYHGTTPREMYHYPKAAPVVRKWLNLRYCLIPYLVDQARRVTASGLPIFRSMIFHHADDPAVWTIDDQYYFGDAFLVAPMTTPTGRRDVYLPEGDWVDFWTGQQVQGPVLLKDVKQPITRMPIYVVKGAKVRVYPELVQCTDDMDLKKAVTLTFDKTYKGFAKSVLGKVVKL